MQIARIKGLFAGTTSLSIAITLGSTIHFKQSLLWAIVLGAFSYGASIVLFILALKDLGSFRTGLFFGFAPFIGAALSLIILKE